MRVYILIAGTLFFYSSILCQNLIINPSFEKYKELSEDVIYPSNWYLPNNSTVDYYSEDCNPNPTFISFTYPCLHIDNKEIGYHKPHDGKAYVGLVLINWQGVLEHITGELKDTLVKGAIYEFSFQIKYPGNILKLYSDHIEILFAEEKPIFRTQQYERLIGYRSFKSYDLRFSLDKANNANGWVECKGTYQARGGEKYLTIGMFYQKNSNNLIKLMEKYKKKYQSDPLKQEDFFIKNSISPIKNNPNAKRTKQKNVLAYYLIDDLKLLPVGKKSTEKNDFTF